MRNSEPDHRPKLRQILQPSLKGSLQIGDVSESFRGQRQRSSRQEPYFRKQNSSLLLSIRLIVILLLVPIPIGLAASASSTFNTKRTILPPETGFCGAIWENSQSGFPLNWRRESNLLAITQSCAIQWACVIACVSYDWIAFSLDTLFYMAICYVAIFLFLFSRSKLKSYSNSVSPLPVGC